MKDAVNSTLVSLNQILHQLKDISINLNSEINTLENSSRDLASITTQQSAALEEITYSIQETNEQVRKNVTTTEETKVLANDSMSQVGNSSSSMEILMAAMHEISKSSEEISGVIKVIDDIAFQTNLLALNAAVEAARAGEHGKGFAVVATEVQNLASKSSEAAKSTASMIAHAINKVTEGVNISNQTSDSLAVISNKAKEINELVNDVFTSNASQSTAINQISVAVNEVNIGVSQCSTNTQSLTQVAHALKNFSHQLSDSMSQFKLNEQKQPSQDCANLPFDLPPNVTVEDLLALINQK
jgi:methyl-accepting chemotaxis protein